MRYIFSLQHAFFNLKIFSAIDIYFLNCIQGKVATVVMMCQCRLYKLSWAEYCYNSLLEHPGLSSVTTVYLNVLG